MRHIVYIPFDKDREKWTLSEAWIKERFKIFNTLTLQSLRNQSFENFDVWILSGKRNQKLVDNFNWHPRVKIVRDDWKERLEEMRYEHIAFSRLDSDDLYHYSALQHIDEVAAKAKSKKIELLIFKRNLFWDRTNKLIGYDNNAWYPPFVTKIYPEKLYKDLEYFKKTFFIKHGKDTLKLGEPRELDPHKVCIVKHYLNISKLRQKTIPQIISKETLETKKKEGKIRTSDPEEMVSILKEFGITSDLALKEPDWKYRR